MLDTSELRQKVDDLQNEILRRDERIAVRALGWWHTDGGVVMVMVVLVTLIVVVTRRQVERWAKQCLHVCLYVSLYSHPRFAGRDEDRCWSGRPRHGSTRRRWRSSRRAARRTSSMLRSPISRPCNSGAMPKSPRMRYAAYCLFPPHRHRICGHRWAEEFVVRPLLTAAVYRVCVSAPTFIGDAEEGPGGH